MISFVNVSKSFGKKIICQNLSFELPESGIVFVNGVSGRGKTTILRLISGLEKANKGEIKYERKLKFSWVFQDDRLLMSKSALDNVAAVLKDNTEKNAEEALKSVGLENDILTEARKLSGGMKRRVAIARALVFPADVYIFDEPFSGIDKDNKDKIIEIIKELSKTKLCIFVSHSESEKNALGGIEITF